MDCLFFPHLKIGFPKNRLFSPTSESWFSYESWWYTLRCTQIARRMVWNVNMLFSLRPVFKAQLRQCECLCQSDLELAGGGGGGGGAVGGFENCVYLWKHPGYTPILYCIHHLWTPLYQVNLNKLKSQGKDLNSASGKYGFKSLKQRNVYEDYPQI